MEKQLRDLENLGHCMVPKVLGGAKLVECQEILQQILEEGSQGVLASRDQGYGIRNLMDLWPEVVELATLPPIRELVQAVLGENAGAVRCLFFDKPPGRSWTLPWHRDLTIAIAEPTQAMSQFRNLTKKAGIHHVNAPPSFLRQMLTLRVALDPMLIENGPLVVQSGKHWPVDDDSNDKTVGESSSKAASYTADPDSADPYSTDPYTTILGEAGDIFVMRPLLPHSSLKSAEGTSLRRRIIHLELSNVRQLPEGLQWHRFEPLF